MQGTFYRFRLYIAGETRNSVRALANLTAICRTSVAGRYSVEVVDVFQEPDRALADKVFMTPTLLKLEPGPVCRIVGALTDADVVLQAMGLAASAA